MTRHLSGLVNKRFTLKIAVVPALVLLLTMLSLLSGKPVVAQATSVENLAPSAWNRDNSLLGIGIDRYRTDSGTVDVHLMSFPETELSAKQWSLEFIDIMIKPDRDAGLKAHVIDEDQMLAGATTNPLNSSGPGVDMATHAIVVIRPGGNRLSVRLRTIVREGEPVQVSLLTRPKGNPSDPEYSALSKITYEARIPLNKAFAITGRDNLIEILTRPLIYPDDPQLARKGSEQTTNKNKNKNKNNQHAAKEQKQQLSSTPKTTKSGQIDLSNSIAPTLRKMPGPRVKFTGKYLNSLPAGYRMHVDSTNYWTNSNMTATRKLNLKLTRDGQFEKSHFSISGGSGGGVTGVVSAGDKNGATGSVSGHTNPQGSGTSSVTLNKRKGLDPAKYGTYYISGKQIELRHANGKVAKHKFVSDGFYSFDLDGKQYFASAPKYWERANAKGFVKYRKYDGSYTANVRSLKNDVKDGTRYLKDMIAKLKGKGKLVSSTPIKNGKTSSKKNYAWSTATFRRDNNRTIEKQIYVRYGRDSKIVEFTRYKNAEGLAAEVGFINVLR
jgi:hypothetical protein